MYPDGCCASRVSDAVEVCSRAMVGAIPTVELNEKGDNCEVMKISKILFLRVGLSCNNKCSMCAGTWTPQPKLTTIEMANKFRLGRSWGFEEVVISGGEPTIRE